MQILCHNMIKTGMMRPQLKPHTTMTHKMMMEMKVKVSHADPKALHWVQLGIKPASLLL